MSGISVHMIVKNEDSWVWFALNSVLGLADQVFITDTGSSDKTIQVIESIASPKITLSRIQASSPKDLTRARIEQIQRTQTEWFWVLDGDEVYTDRGVQEIAKAVKANYHGIAVRRYDLLGDIYHRQRESVGQYQLLGQRGHLVTRLVRKSAFPSLHLVHPYPLEAYVDQEGRVIHSYNQDKWYITSNHLYHAMYLKRSSLGSNLPMFNRNKYKVETGISITTSPPEVFSLTRPQFVPDPLSRRTLGYELATSIITPIKDLKRFLYT